MKKLYICPSEDRVPAAGNGNEERIDPELDNAIVTYDEMCLMHEQRGHDLTDVQLACHWRNLPLHCAPAEQRTVNTIMNCRADVSPKQKCAKGTGPKAPRSQKNRQTTDGKNLPKPMAKGETGSQRIRTATNGGVGAH